MTLQIESDSLAATEKLAAAIGRRLRGGEIITLQSDLGGGKTAFVRGLAAGMDSPDTVNSPTFTLSCRYDTASGLILYHFDFYRLTEPGIMADDLAEIITDPQAIIAIEWGAVVADVLPKDRLDIVIKPTGETTRLLELTCPPDLTYLVEDVQ